MSYLYLMAEAQRLGNLPTVEEFDFYLSASGNNTTGTSPATAFTSFAALQAKLNDGTIPGGSTIGLKRGEQYAGSLNVLKGLTLGAYGTGERPIINGLQPVTGWSNLGNNIYSKTIGTTEPLFMLWDGIPVGKGSFPTTPDYYFSSVVNTSGDWSLVTAICEDLNGYDFTGGEIVMTLNEWAIGVYTILSHSGNTVTFSVHTSYKPTNSIYDKFNIQNHPDVFTQNGDWAIIDSTLYVYCDNDINSHSVVIPTIEHAFYVDTPSDFSVNDIDIKGISKKVLFPVNEAGSANIYLKNMKVDYATQFSDFSYGIYNVGGWRGDTFKSENVDLNYIFDASYKMGGFISDVTITKGTITNCGMFRGLGKINQGGYNGVVVFTFSDNLTCEFLNMDNLGYNGVAGSGTQNTYVRYNYIKNTNHLLIDGGGIHIGANPSGLVHIYNNILDNCERGIYQDFGGSSYRIHHNIVMNCTYSGYYCNDAKYTDVYGNIFYGNYQNIRLQQWYDETNLGEITDLDIYDNVIFTKQDWDFYMQYHFGTMSFPSSDWVDAGFGSLHDNISVQWADGLSSRLIGGSSPSYNTRYSFAQWKAKGYDVNSALIVQPNPELLYNATSEPVTTSFSGFTKTDARGNNYVNGITLQPYTGVVIVQTNAN